MRTSGGTEGVPGYSFIEDPDTGIWRPGTNRLQFSTAGAGRWEIDASGHLIPVDDDTYDIGSASQKVRHIHRSLESYTPALTSTGTTPNLGASGTVEGYYYDDGLVKGIAVVRFQGAGVSAGTGNYRFSLPVPADTGFYETTAAYTIGTASAVAAGNGRTGVPRIQTAGATPQLANIQQSDTPYSQWSSTNPGAWASGDRIIIEFMYLPA